MALFNGILKETNPQLGDAARLSEQFAGKQAQAAAQTTILKQQIGQALQPALASLFSVVTPMIVAVADWTSKHQNLAAALIIGTAIILGVVAAVGALGVAVATITPALPVLAAVATGAFGAISVGAAGAHAAVAGLTSFVGGPAALGAWGGFAAAAIGAFVLIQNKANETNGVLDETLRRIQGVQKGDEAAIRVLQGKANDARARGDQATANKYAQQIRTIYGSIPGFAGGTSFAPGGMALVGERGPELVDLPRGSKVYTADKSRGPSAGVQIHQTNNIYNQIDMGAMLRDLSWRLRTA
jgi:phage-related tail protein